MFGYEPQVERKRSTRILFILFVILVAVGAIVALLL